KDDSADEIVAAGARLVRHPVNLGQGAAIQTGVEYARMQPGARFFVTFDADGQHRVEDVVAMIERLRTEPVDIVVGTRFAEGRSESVPPLRR
ncbi:glycosyltransferase family 2 protein, partial [Streptomyces sp. SID10244]|nr:glycosyltransferase family 2 protein [Streptomyces sp. SID10244]